MKKIIKPTKYILFFGIFLCVLFFSYKAIKIEQMGNVLGASSPWTQTDWSGGQDSAVVSGSVDTYLSKAEMNTDVANSLTVSQISGWSADYTQWAYRRKIVFDNTDLNLGVPAEALVDFPVLVKLDAAQDIDYTKTQNQGQDIRFTDSDGTILNYEIETWDESGSSFIWVKVPSININSNTDSIYMYYNNPDAVDAQNRSSVWSNGYAMVQHLNDASTSTVIDSTSNNYTGTKRTTNAPVKIPGKIGFAQDCGPSDYIDLGNILNPGSNNFTVEIWFRRQSVGTANINILYNKENLWETAAGGGYTTLAWMPYWNWVGGSASPLTLNQWHYSAISYDKINQIMYRDGSSVFTRAQTGNLGTNTARLQICARGDTGHSSFFDGDVDEMRVSMVSRSAAWLSASYHSDSDDFNSFQTEESKLFQSGTLESNILDSGVSMDWGLLTYTNSGTGTVTVKVRTDNASNMSGASAWGTCTAITSATDISANNCVDDGDRYVQYQVTLQPSGALTPVFEDISIAFVPSDQLPPEVNATEIEISGLANSGDWYATEPTIRWIEGTDDPSGNGILGYCLAIDEAEPDSSNGLNPAMVSGILTGKNDGVPQTYCPYIVVGDQFDVSGVQGLDLNVGKQYFISIKAVDIAGNIYTGSDETWKDILSFKFDNEAPTAPFYISLPANFLSSKDVVVTWPVGVGGADDVNSGLAGLQYRIGETGTWYGDLHTGTEDINDLLINDGSYVTDETYDYPGLVEGNNFIYFRAVDNLGNLTAPQDYVKGILKLNTVAPSPVRNLEVNPLNGTDNSYTFTWDVPSTYTGSSSGITYCYTVNSLPSVSNCVYTDPGMTSIGPDAFATQPGENTMYVVAKDEAGNINYATYSEPGSSVTYTYSGTAPGMAHNLDVADISVKATENWRLVLSWDQPQTVGAGISYYNVYRSETATSCASSFASFTKVGSSTSTSYIDPNLDQKTYNYCIKACDSANNCSASSGTVGRLPTGKFTEPALLLSAPEVVSFTTRKAVINWITDRVSDSSIQYGLESGVYLPAEVAISNQLAVHTIPLDNLKPGTTYYYRAKWTDVDGNTGVSEEKTFATLPPPKVIEVNTSDIRTDSALITFRVSSATSVELLYGPTLSYGGTITTATSTAESVYTSRITNLNEDSLYNFKLILRDVEGNDYDSIENNRFTTLPYPRVQDIQVQEIKNSAQPSVNVLWGSNIPVTTLLRYYPLGNPEQKRDQIDLELKIDHNMEIIGLNANTKYGLVISGRDAIGNEAASDEYQFTTDEDSRPPVISNIKVETRMSNDGGADSQAQLIVSWDTDEAATSQVEYGEGSTGEYTQKTLVDDNSSFNHLIIINNLRPSSVYHLRVLSEDSVGNEAQGRNMVTISAQLSENPLDIIISRLTEAFGFIR